MALKKRALKVFFSVCLSSVILFCLFILVRNITSKIKKEKEILSLADSIVNENIVKGKDSNYQQVECENEEFSVEKLEEDNNIVGKIIIDKIDVNAPIMDGVDQETLKLSVGHFSCSGYWFRECMSSIT